MHSKALVPLRDFFHPILCFLGMATPPPIETEFPERVSVLDWENMLMACYRSRCPLSSTPQRSRMKTLKVVTIRRFKKKNTEHEYVVAKVYDPNLGRSRYLRIGDLTPNRCYCCRTFIPVRHHIRATSSQPSVVLENGLRHVRTIAAWPTGDICIEIAKCRDSQMIVLDLAIVAKLVFKQSPEYQASTRQCFSYSAMIISVLRKSFPQIKVSNNASWLKAGHGRKMEVSDKKGGTYRCIPSYSEQPEVITGIYNLFETHKADIYSSVNHLNTGYIFADYSLP